MRRHTYASPALHSKLFNVAPHIPLPETDTQDKDQQHRHTKESIHIPSRPPPPPDAAAAVDKGCGGQDPDEGEGGPLLVGLTSDQVPAWQRFPFITQGYRKGGDVQSCLASWFRMHNETANVWTVLLSLLAGLACFFHSLVSVQPAGLDVLPFAALILAQVLHTPLSVSYHTFMCVGVGRATYTSTCVMCVVPVGL